VVRRRHEAPSIQEMAGDGSGEQKLFMGHRQSIRIRISTGLSGLATEPRLQGPGDEGTRFRAHQYSFLAFGRFFYNRICRCVDSDYPPLPASAIATATPIPRQVISSSSSGLRHAAEPVLILTPLDAATAENDDVGEASMRDGGEGVLLSETRSETKARLMNELRACVTPHQDPSVEPVIFTLGPEIGPTILQRQTKLARTRFSGRRN
jgi:hypothetical protein